MSTVEACLNLLEELPGTVVESLVDQLRCGVPARMANPAYQGRVDDFLRTIGPHKAGLASMLELALAARRSRPSLELVWTGPSTSVVPVRRTEQVLFELIQEAKQMLTIMSFGVFQVPRLVEALEDAVARGLILRIVLGDREADSEWAIENQRAQLGTISHRASLYWWPHERRLRDANGRAGLMHAKAAIADSRIAFLTSANLTEAALERNMELGILIRGGGVPGSIERLLDALIEQSELKVI